MYIPPNWAYRIAVGSLAYATTDHDRAGENIIKNIPGCKSSGCFITANDLYFTRAEVVFDSRTGPPSMRPTLSPADGYIIFDIGYTGVAPYLVVSVNERNLVENPHE